MVSSILLVVAGFSFVLSRFRYILFVFYESFIPFMMHCLWSKCQSSIIVCPTLVCVHYVLVALWIPNLIITSQRVYFIRLKLDLSCHLHVKHPLLLGVCVAKNYSCCLYLRECLFWIWCTPRNGPEEMASVWFELSNKALLTSWLFCCSWSFQLVLIGNWQFSFLICKIDWPLSELFYMHLKVEFMK